MTEVYRLWALTAKVKSCGKMPDGEHAFLVILEKREIFWPWAVHLRELTKFPCMEALGVVLQEIIMAVEKPSDFLERQMAGLTWYSRKEAFDHVNSVLDLCMDVVADAKGGLRRLKSSHWRGPKDWAPAIVHA